jgi:hypothetical protein
MQWWIFNKNISQQIPVSVLFLGLKFGKILGFPQSEQWEQGTSFVKLCTFSGL